MRGRSLLIASPAESWREWLKQHRGDRDLLRLDPADPNFDAPARLSLHRGDRVIGWRFFGSLDVSRAPHVLLAAASELLSLAGEDALVQAFAYQPSPLRHQLALMLAQLIRPEQILIGQGCLLDQSALPVGPEVVELESAFQEMVGAAQRKAQWMKLREACEPHAVPLTQVAIEGARLGSGTRLTRTEIASAGLEAALYAERIGVTLFAVVESEPDASLVSRALDAFHCQRAHFVEPRAYDNLLCSFAKPSGEDFGMGFVDEFDWNAGTIRLACTAVPPAPVRILRLGSLKVGPKGDEFGEVRPWQV